jgi:hypothetical protein
MQVVACLPSWPGPQYGESGGLELIGRWLAESHRQPVVPAHLRFNLLPQTRASLVRQQPFGS